MIIKIMRIMMRRNKIINNKMGMMMGMNIRKIIRIVLMQWVQIVGNNNLQLQVLRLIMGLCGNSLARSLMLARCYIACIPQRKNLKYITHQ